MARIKGTNPTNPRPPLIHLSILTTQCESSSSSNEELKEKRPENESTKTKPLRNEELVKNENEQRNWQRKKRIEIENVVR
jgi:hypothetical protein